MASSVPPAAGGPPRDAPEPAGDGVVWHSTCGYAECVEPSRYAADSICKGCRRIKYCTFACQKADWKRHKAACRVDEAADEAAAREGALVVRPRARAPPPRPELLRDAAKEGNLRHVDALLRLGADVNAADEDGFTPLSVASARGKTAVVSALLASPGVAINAARPNGCTPLYDASEFGHAAVVSAILAMPGADVNAGLTSGWTPLHIASKMGHAAVVSALLASPGVLVNAVLPRQGETPLHLASDSGLVAVVTALLASPGVLVNAALVDGQMPLHIALQMGHAAVVSALFALADVDVNATSKYGYTPLHVVSYEGAIAAIAVLLEHPKVDVNPRTFDGVDATPLRIARARGHLAIAALLEARGGVV